MDTERRIEKEIAEQEEKERKVLLGIKSVSREASPDTEEQVQPNQQGERDILSTFAISPHSLLIFHL
jgi:hypothetical protein